VERQDFYYTSTGIPIQQSLQSTDLYCRRPHACVPGCDRFHVQLYCTYCQYTAIVPSRMLTYCNCTITCTVLYTVQHEYLSINTNLCCLDIEIPRFLYTYNASIFLLILFCAEWILEEPVFMFNTTRLFSYAVCVHSPIANLAFCALMEPCHSSVLYYPRATTYL